MLSLMRKEFNTEKLTELYKKFLQDESIETKSVDLFLEDIEQQAEENRKKISELGFWTEGSNE
jgi:anaerobic ribonucleoside-triphosphate reductase